MTSKSRDFENEEIFVRPMCLINSTKDRGFYIEENVLRQIQKIDVPLVVVAIVGLYRTGKSYLMNRLAGVSAGFPLGSTVESTTKGIWAWCQKHPEIPDTILLLLDTEGLGDISKADQGHDNCIFTLATLLCNVLVYNVMTTLNEDVVQKLTFISELSNNIRFANKSDIPEENDQLELILPSFVLCIRDFTLILKVGDETISADEYLENCLRLKPEKGLDTERYNRYRESLRKYFPKRKCFVFDAPGTRSTLQQLENLHLEELSPNFVNETKQFLAYIYTRKPKVLLTSKPVTGTMFVPLVETYVKAITDGAVPDVDDAIMAVARTENERIAKIAVEKFKTYIDTVKLPVLQALEIDSLREKLQAACLAQFRREFLFDKDGKYEREAFVEMDRLWEKVKADNLKLLESHCTTVFNDIYASVATKIKDGVYCTKGGYNAYKNDIAKIKTQYKCKVKGVDEAVTMQVLYRLMENEESNETSILKADQELSEEERKREMEKLHSEQKEQRNMLERVIKEEAEKAERAKEHAQWLEEQRKQDNRQNEKQMKELTDIWAEQRKWYDMQIKELTAKNTAEREAYKKELTSVQNSIRRQNEEAETRFQQELEEYKIRTEQLEQKIGEILELVNQNEEDNQERITELISNKRQGSVCEIL